MAWFGDRWDSGPVRVAALVLGAAVFVVSVVIAVAAFHRTPVGCNPGAPCDPRGFDYHLGPRTGLVLLGLAVGSLIAGMPAVITRPRWPRD